MKRTSPEITNKIITLIAQGYNISDVAKRCKLNPATVDGVKIDNLTAIQEVKKGLQEKMVESAADKISALAGDMLKGSQLAMNLIIAKIQEASPAQAAVILGILQDKYNMILGNPSVNVSIKFQGRTDMIDYVKSGVKKNITPRAPVPVIETAKIEGAPKPLYQIAKEYRDTAKIKRGRGRPRIHPLPDPNIPKRGRGRPRKISPLTSIVTNPDNRESSHIL